MSTSSYYHSVVNTDKLPATPAAKLEPNIMPIPLDFGQYGLVRDDVVWAAHALHISLLKTTPWSSYQNFTAKGPNSDQTGRCHYRAR